MATESSNGWLNTILNNVGSAYGATTAAETAKEARKSEEAKAKAAQAAQKKTPAWLIPALIGGGLLLVVGIVFAFRK